MRPVGEVLDTVMVDRGGAPLHFVLTHAVFWVETSADALRWLSVACALAAIPLCFDLGRRLGGASAGIVSAAIVASSTALAVYGSFGRMYTLFVLVAALAADLFVRAVQLRTRRAVIVAAAAAWLLPAVHPYGLIPALAMLAVAAVLWRRRSLREAMPVLLIALAAVPFLVADLRLADRAQVASESGEALASPGDAWGELVAALSAFAGGDGIPFLAFTVLALLGLVVLVRSEPAVAAVSATVVLPPLLFLLLRAGSAPDLSPRHLFYALPLWAAAIGVGSSWLIRRLPAGLAAVAVAAVALGAVSSPASGLRDPREFSLLPTETTPYVQAEPGDMLFPYSIPFLARLDSVQGALALPQGPGEEIVAALEHAHEPIAALHLAMPRTGGWSVETRPGPFRKSEALIVAAEAYGTATVPEFAWWYRLVTRGLCDAVRELGRKCPT